MEATRYAMSARMYCILAIDEDDPTAGITATCNSHGDGHTASVTVAEGVTIQATGDGARRLCEWLDTARRKVEEAHTQWLIAMSREAE